MIDQRTFCKENIEDLKQLDKFQKASDRNNHFTTTRELKWYVEEHKDGYYYIAEGTQTKTAQFVNRLGENTRKPRNSKMIKEVLYGYES